LYAADDGLAHVSEIVRGAADWLAPGGTVVIEIGSGQGDAVARLMHDAGLVEVQVRPDLAGLARFAQAKRAAT
jgi:release factor glutamine methyltransferase